MTYKPKTIDTSKIQLSKELKELQEILSRNAHEVWAETRIKDGWVYGEKRNDEIKQHPCLVPYDQLPESEKEYDRVLAMNTLKLITKLGYEIRKVEK
ncbi:RyR domain-containing protein [Clostridium grantii]|uniref:RyR domain-containing protein n=1 Tax=Clostridium grantii DSM 8605 TaxID=1121316 RepID=A0A1M5R1H9_9CLOT|nr:RyR domain-containing protein [Clostridium grantii]SHH19819.1 RyR domain-containing protein [Clostridium grantii DSM 8605]